MTMGTANLIILCAILFVSVCDGQFLRNNSTDGCSLILDEDGKSSKSLMLTDVGLTSDIFVVGVGMECELTILLVGGGGGGGSGYLEYRSITVEARSIVTVRVGDPRQSSSVSLSNGDTYMAQPGGERGCAGGHCSDGGDGYSGGGALPNSQLDRGGNGGSDGGNGGDVSDGGKGGKGTGEDISKYTFNAWTLSPGSGGRHDDYIPGGGGGVLVDGAGPRADEYNGEGYGGGGGGYYNTGSQGVILIETV